jgi:hypothetical protein
MWRNTHVRNFRFFFFWLVVFGSFFFSFFFLRNVLQRVYPIMRRLGCRKEHRLDAAFALTASPKILAPFSIRFIFFHGSRLLSIPSLSRGMFERRISIHR